MEVVMDCESWPAAMDRAIGPQNATADTITQACAEVSNRLTAAIRDRINWGQDGFDEDIDWYTAALNLLRRWSTAARLVADGHPFDADILLHDYRPIRPYAIRLGQQIERIEQDCTSRPEQPAGGSCR